MGDTITGRIDTDRTGEFPVVSSQGNLYILILYNYDINAILAELMKPRKGGEILREYRKLFLHLHKRGIWTKLQRLYNEV